MWKNQFLGLRKMTKIKVMTNMAEGIGEKQLLFQINHPLFKIASGTLLLKTGCF